jgi:hypothetical protein
MSTRLQEDLQTASRTIKRQQKQIIEMRGVIAKANAYLRLGNGADARKLLSESVNHLGVYGQEAE